MEIKELVLLWSRKYKLDFIYRKKNKLRFNSKEHREVNPISMCFELLEDQLFKEAMQSDDVKATKEKEVEDNLFDQIELE